MEGRDAIIEALERQASIVEGGAWRQDGLQLQGELLVLVFVGRELLGGSWALLDPVDGIEGLRGCARRSQEKTGCQDSHDYHFGFHFLPSVERSRKTRISRLIWGGALRATVQSSANLADCSPPKDAAWRSGARCNHK
jgi:hypothetical protein